MTFKQRISSQLITWWAIVIFSLLVLMGSFHTFAFGLFCFTYLFAEWIRTRKENTARGWGVRGTFLFVAIIWFIVNLIIEISIEPEFAVAIQDIDSSSPVSGFYMVIYRLALVSLLPLAFLFPLLDQMHFYSEAESDISHTKLFKRFYFVLISFSLTGLFVSIYLAYKWFLDIPIPEGRYLGGIELSDEHAVSMLLIFFCLLFILNYLLSLFSSETRFWNWRGEGPFFLGLHIKLIVAILFTYLLFQTIQDFGRNEMMASPLVRFLPLVFLFLNVFYEQKLTFFDLFVKRATFFFVALIGVASYFVVSAHFTGIIKNEEILMRLMALDWLFIFLVAPWLYKMVDVLLDRIWLNRQKSPENVVRRFMEVLQFETREDVVLQKSGLLLTEVFNSRAEVTIVPEAADNPEGSELDLFQEELLEKNEKLRLRMYPRPNRIPYYDRDRILLRGLLEILVYYMKLIRLQEDRRVREIREQELLLDASKSRLKALRAQINPHFLFNALNAIASFTKTDPDKAEKTVELLSEIFRYTLQYSEREWVRLEEELDFISAYLEVEQARFGDRLSAEISMEVETGGMLIPAMIVQTLAENAVKHGISRVKKRGLIKISSVTDGTKLWITVWDNGPGFESGLDTSLENKPGVGMGLTNVRNRLRGYFGEKAEFSLIRDETGVLAQVMIPVVNDVKSWVK
jgi:signal transduction histidine kinase